MMNMTITVTTFALGSSSCEAPKSQYVRTPASKKFTAR